MTKRALILGLSGQDGSYMADLLLEKDYQVFGVVRRCADRSLERMSHFLSRVELIVGDITDQTSLERAVGLADPHEIYNFAGLTFVPDSWLHPEQVLRVNGLGPVYLMEAMRLYCPTARLYQASSSEMFGSLTCGEGVQDEDTPLRPCSPYGAAKAYAHALAQQYRKKYGLHVSCGIAFNHESPRRGTSFVTRKITRALARMVVGSTEVLELGTLGAKRDWSCAQCIVEGAWRMVQQETPDDYVLASGGQHTVGEFLSAAAARAQIELTDRVRLCDELVRRNEVISLRGNPAKAKEFFGWEVSCSFEDLVAWMVDSDLASLRGHPLPPSPHERRAAVVDRPQSAESATVGSAGGDGGDQPGGGESPGDSARHG